MHTVTIEGTVASLSLNGGDINNPTLLINHYSTQSKNWFLGIKSKRGDVNNWVQEGARNEKWFNISDINDVEDTRLAEQNKQFNIAMKLRRRMLR